MAENSPAAAASSLTSTPANEKISLALVHEQLLSAVALQALVLNPKLMRQMIAEREQLHQVDVMSAIELSEKTPRAS